MTTPTREDLLAIQNRAETATVSASFIGQAVDLAIKDRNTLLDLLERAERQRNALLEACKAAKAFGSQGDTEEGISVSYLLDKAIAQAEKGGE